MPIDFQLTDAQRQQQQDARNFATKVLGGAHATYSKLPTQSARFQAIRPFYRIATAGGFIKGQMPVPLGGTNESLLDAAIALEEMYMLRTNWPRLDPAYSEWARAFAEGMFEAFPQTGEDGEALASLAHSEPQGTANWLEKGGNGLQTTAAKDGDDWVVNGEKLWTTNSAGWDSRGANLQCLVCRQVREAGAPQDPHADPSASIIVFCLTRQTIASNSSEAYEILDEPELAGHPATSGPHTRFTNLRIPSSFVLAQGTAAAQLIEQSITASAALVAAFATSIMRSAFDAALSFAKADSRGGAVPIIERQSVADLLMDTKLRLDSTRLLTWKALHALEKGPGDFPSRQELCLEAKIYGSENAVKAVVDCMKVVGMTSYRTDQPFARLLNDAMCLPLFDGGNVGVRRRQLEKILKMENYESTWGF